MPILYERDDTRRLVVVTVQGAFPTSEMIPVIERQRREDTWSYGILYDLRRMTGHPALGDLRAVMDKVASYGPAQGPRGPVALLMTDPILYAAGCRYAALGRSKLRIQVFRDLDEANLWLTAETRP